MTLPSRCIPARVPGPLTTSCLRLTSRVRPPFFNHHFTYIHNPPTRRELRAAKSPHSPLITPTGLVIMSPPDAPQTNASPSEYHLQSRQLMPAQWMTANTV